MADLPGSETITMKSGTELVVIYAAGQMWTDKDGNVVDYDWLATKYLEPGGRFDELCPKVGDSFDRKQLAQAMYDELTGDDMREKYKAHQTDGTVRANLIQREARMIYFLEYLGVLEKKPGRTGIFKRTAKANEVKLIWATEQAAPPTPTTPAEPNMTFRRVVVLPDVPETVSDRQRLARAYQHHRREASFHRETADALARVLGLDDFGA